MTPEQLCQHLRLKPEQLASACTQARVTMPAAGSVFSATQIERISELVAERRRNAAANRTAGGTTGGQVTRDPDAAIPGRATVGGTRGGAATRDGGEKSIGPERAGTTVGGRAESEARIDTKVGDNGPRTASRSADLSNAVAMLELEDGFEIKKILGQGGMGSVIHAVERSSGREVAIKRLLSEGTSPKLLNQLVSEYRATLHLSHANIVRSYNVYRDSKGPYFSMEYVEGKTLQDRLSAKDAKLSVKEAFEIFVPLADALAHAHSGKKPVVHRDIKPANILLTKGGMAKLADFGIAMEGESSSQNADFVGTVKFMAPEQYVDSRNCNHLSDQYSFAATIYFALTRLPPKDFNPKKVPAAFREFLTRAMQEAPYKRFPSTAEMAQALRDSAPDSVVNKSESSEQGLDLRIFFGGLAVCLVLVAGIIFMVMRKPEPQPIATTPASATSDSTEINNSPEIQPAEPEIVAAPPAPPEDWPPKGIMPGEVFSMEEAVAQATSQKKAIFLYWWKESSEECKQMHLETFKDPTVLSTLAERFVILRINADKDTTTGANIFQPTAFPAFAVVDAASNQALAKSPPDRAAYMDAATLSVWLRQATQSFVADSGDMNPKPGTEVGGSGNSMNLDRVKQFELASPKVKLPELPDFSTEPDGVVKVLEGLSADSYTGRYDIWFSYDSKAVLALPHDNGAGYGGIFAWELKTARLNWSKSQFAGYGGSATPYPRKNQTLVRKGGLAAVVIYGNGTESPAIELGGGVGPACWSSDGSLLATAGERTGAIQIIDRLGTIIHTYNAGIGIQAICFSQNSDSVLFATGQSIRRWQFISDDVQDLREHSTTVRSLHCHPTTDYVMSVATPFGRPLDITVWSLGSPKTQVSFVVGETVAGYQVSDDWRRVVSAEQDGTVAVWELPEEKQVARYEVSKSDHKQIANIALSRSGTLAAIHEKLTTSVKLLKLPPVTTASATSADTESESADSQSDNSQEKQKGKK